MKRFVYLVLLLTIGFASYGYCASEDAVWDNRSVPSTLAVYGSTETKRLQTDVDGNLKVVVQGNVTSAIAGTVQAYVSSGTITVTDSHFANKVSSGTSGLITGQATATVTVADNVVAWSFLMENVGSNEYASITPSIWGTPIKLKDGQSNSEYVDIPAPVTFTITLPATSTMTYTARTVKP